MDIYINMDICINNYIERERAMGGGWRERAKEREREMQRGTERDTDRYEIDRYRDRYMDT